MKVDKTAVMVTALTIPIHVLSAPTQHANTADIQQRNPAPLADAKDIKWVSLEDAEPLIRARIAEPDSNNAVAERGTDSKGARGSGYGYCSVM